MYRWGATPLQDAINSGHMQLANIMIAMGGIVPVGYGISRAFTAAANGDVRNLNLLMDCAEIQVAIKNGEWLIALNF